MSNAHARDLEFGQALLGIGIGPGLSMGSKLGLQPADFLFLPQGELAFGHALSAVGSAALGFGGTAPLLGRLGARLRAHNLNMSLSPYVELGLSGGGLMKVLGSRLRFVGARVGLGVEYAAAARARFGVGLGLTLGSTLGGRPAFYGLFDGSLYVSFVLNRAAAGSTLDPAFTPASS